ncbi:MAG: InlB B-repeat-containing protein [Paludibacteraceae bacterium]|nr:InlB B-repeat-containing protein [Paludibacteraceae bacterium]
MKRIFLSIFALCCLAMTASATKVYVNPGHGSWGPNCRPMATINYAAGDTLGFFESNTNLWKAFELENKLLGAGFSVKLSRRASGGSGTNQWNKALSTICTEATNYGADYYISIHSNAGPDGSTGSFANYPVILYRGYTGSPKVAKSDAMSKKAMARLYEIFYTTPKNKTSGGPEFTTSYSPSNPRIVGDLSFYDTSSTYGYLGALKHNIPGYLSEGYFHTYSPARHRALNPDWCRQEGVRYFRGIMDYYGKAGEKVGYIMGYVRSKTEQFSHKHYIPHSSSNDIYKPINGAKIVLRNDKEEVIKCNCYPYVKRMLKNQDYYTTDHNYNGVFMFENLAPGKYTLYVHANGYKDVVQTVTVTADKTIYPEIFMEKGAGTEPNVAPADPDIEWELNGGYVPGGTVPSNDELWEQFKSYYLSYYNINRADQPIENVATFASAYMEDIMTNEKSDYKWLGDYILTIAGSISGESAWRWHVHAFFNCNDGTVTDNQKVATANFSDAGKPEKWGPAYQIAMGTSAALPYKVTSTYTLPTPIKEGYVFLGWFDNANGTGTALTTIPAGWQGTLYAMWEEEAPADVKWMLNGGTVSTTLPREITGTAYTLPTPKKTGYVFLGWFDNANGTGTALSSLPVGYKGTIYAIWREAKVTWELNGGKAVKEVLVSDGSVKVPTNEELFTTFMNDYNTYYKTSINTASYSVAKGNVANFLYNGKANSSVDITTLLQDASAGWKWLGDYLQKSSTENGLPLEEETQWRYSLAAFFMCGTYTDYNVDFSTMGQAAVWGPTYEAAHGGGTKTVLEEITLPSKITGNAYTIPTPVKDGATFQGWYDNAAGSGDKLTVLPVGYDGTVYAIWDKAQVVWVLNGGKVLEEVTIPGNTVNVPTQEELWASFKTAAGLTTLGTLAEITEAGAGKPHTDQNNPCACRIICGKLDGTMVKTVLGNAEWTWLRDYIITVQTTLTIEDLTTAAWRYAVAAFFLQTEHNSWPASANFATAGKPEAWGPAYQKAHGGNTSSTTEWREVTLPSAIVGEPYTIPTPVKDGDAFVGWFDNANATGTALTVLPVGYQGTVYAIWKSTPTSVEQIVNPVLDIHAPMYDIMGRQVDENYRGIIIQNGHKYLLR